MGQIRAKLYNKRLGDLRNARTLEDIRHFQVITTNSPATAKDTGPATLTNRIDWYLSHMKIPFQLMKMGNTSG